jgi:hypothetical protein
MSPCAQISFIGERERGREIASTIAREVNGLRIGYKLDITQLT